MSTITDYACPNCGYDGPHDVFAINEAECGDCHAEFSFSLDEAADWDCGSGMCDPNTGCPSCSDEDRVWVRRR